MREGLMHRLALVTAHDLLLDDEWYRAGGSATIDQRLQDEQDDLDRQREREDARPTINNERAA